MITMTGAHFVQADQTKSKNSEVREILLTDIRKDSVGTDYSYKHEVVWRNAVGFLILHILAGYGLFLLLTGTLKFITLVWILCIHMLASEGVTVGAHRCYSHRAFKAKPLLRAIFLLLHTISGQNSMYVWCRDHRLHHRYSDTDADPHNAQRGFFFSHIGWLMTKKHPLVKKFGKRLDLSDLEADWMVMFQRRKIVPVESLFVSFITYGEGWHNYHHAFPWDYKAAELTMHMNLSASVIRFLEFIGLAWDLKSASPEMVENRIFRTGDGTHYRFGNDEARTAVTAIGYVHPFNPTYNSVKKASEAPEPDSPVYHENDVGY